MNIKLCCTTLLVLGLSACVPAHYVQRPTAEKTCEVQVCRNHGTGFDRCECKRHRDVEAQMQALIGPNSAGPWE